MRSMTPGGEQHRQKDDAEHQSRSQIRLLQNQHGEQTDHYPGRGDRRPEIIQIAVALAFGQEPGQENDQRNLRQLRRLRRKAFEKYPPVRVVDFRKEEYQQQQDDATAQKSVDETGLRELVIVNP